MLRSSKLIAGVLIAVSITAVFPVIVWAGSATQMGHADRCHHEFPIPSAPGHPSHQCCVSGHQWAVPALAVTLGWMVAERIIDAENRNLDLSLLMHGRPVSLSQSPPIQAFLRI